MSTALKTPATIAESIRATIRASGLNISELSALTGVPRSTLHRQIVSGEIWLDVFLALCHALKTDPATILASADPDATPDAAAIVGLLNRLGRSERAALKGVIESAVELRAAAVETDRMREGRKGPPVD